MSSTALATVGPARRVHGRVRPPGDKSLSHRYALLAALADGRSTIRHYAPGADCASTLDCLRQLGVRIAVSAPSSDTPDERVVDIAGRGLGGLQPAEGPLDAGNSGTTMRLLAGVLAAHGFTSTLVGDASLSTRPMGRVIEPLRRMGATVRAAHDRPPLVIEGGALHGMTHAPSVPSAQVKSAVLLAGLHATGTTTVVESAPTRDHTERALRAFGATVDVDGPRVTVSGGQSLRPIDTTVAGDASSAAFWAVAAAALPGSALELIDVNLNPTRTAFLDVLERAGAIVERAPEGERAGEPFGTIRVSHGTLRPFAIAPDEVPAVIDELPALAALATFGGELTVTGAGELRVKESDRIALLVRGVRALGGDIEEYPDGFRIRGRHRLRGGRADASGDHRLAMAFGIAGLGAEGPCVIEQAEAVDVSYPDFFRVMETLCDRAA